MKTKLRVIVILTTGLILGLVGRQIRQQSANLANQNSGPGPDEVVHTTDFAPGETVEVDPDSIANPDVIRPLPDEEWLSRFELIERSGELVTSEDLLGQPYVVSFFFSSCPGVCPQQNQKVKELQDAFKGQGVRLIAISVDPETDTPEVLREYAARYGADPEQWLFLTGDLTYIQRVGAEVFGQAVEKNFHTEKFILVDAKGKIEGLYSWKDKRQFEKLQSTIKSMI